VPVAFDTYLVRPLLTGGSGQIQTAMRVTGDVLERVVVKIGGAPAASVDDPLLVSVEIDLGDNPGDGSLRYATFHKALADADVVASWFAKLTTGGWVAGPIVDSIDLTAKYSSNFPWLKTQIIDLLQQIQEERPPAFRQNRAMTIRGAFPRDSFGLPAMSVQLTTTPSGAQLIGDTDRVGTLTGQPKHWARGFNATVDIIAWTDQPEERDVIAEWLGGALMVLVETLPFFGAAEPTFTINESEDFESLKTPAFLVTGTLNFSVWSDLTSPVPTSYGHLQLVQEAP
jgi:hypothetical protein